MNRPQTRRVLISSMRWDSCSSVYWCCSAMAPSPRGGIHTSFAFAPVYCYSKKAVDTWQREGRYSESRARVDMENGGKDG